MSTKSSSQALVKSTFSGTGFFSGYNKDIPDEATQNIVNLIKEQYADLYRISANGMGLLITNWSTSLELLAEFDQMSWELLNFKGWIEIRRKDCGDYGSWHYGEVELKPLKSRDGIIYCLKGTIEWLNGNMKDCLKEYTRPLSVRVRYEFPSGKISALVPNKIGDSEVLKKAVVEYRSSSELKFEITT